MKLTVKLNYLASVALMLLLHDQKSKRSLQQKGKVARDFFDDVLASNLGV